MRSTLDRLSVALPDWAFGRLRAYLSPAYRGGRDIKPAMTLKLVQKHIGKHPNVELRERLRALLAEDHEQAVRAAGLLVVWEILFSARAENEKAQMAHERASRWAAGRLDGMIRDAERTLEHIGRWSQGGHDDVGAAAHLRVLVDHWRMDAAWHRRQLKPKHRPCAPLNAKATRAALRACGLSDREAGKLLGLDVTGSAARRGLGRK